jgi:hypothetical protein
MACVRNTVVKGVGREQAQLDLDGRDGMYGMGLADRVRAGLAQPDAADLALLDQFGQRLDQGLDRDLGVDPRTFKDVDRLGVGWQHLDRRVNTVRAAVGAFLRVVGAFNAEHDLVGVLGMLFEVVLDQMQRICPEACRSVGSACESA